MTGNDRILINELIDIFIDQVNEIGKELEEAYSRSNFEWLGKLAHKAKSSVAIMGMNKLSKKLKEFELLAKEQKDVDQYASFIEMFDKSCKEAIQELNEIVKNI